MQPVPSAEDTRANATYDALLWALSRPGQIRELPDTGEQQIIDALLDRECRVYAADPRLIPAILRSGAEVAELEEADHVFLGPLTSLGALPQICRGSDLYPDDGATVILSADLTKAPRLRLTGPGVDGSLDVGIGGLPIGFWQDRRRLMRYPMGFELFVLDGNRIMGLPRSTNVGVL
ncbi:MAG: phosphonate C-P lyase system protein PhnH [Pseudomonadota bacterium]